MADNQVQIAFPISEVFKNGQHRFAPANKVLRKTAMYDLVNVEYPTKEKPCPYNGDTGGIYPWFKDCPYPNKGFPFPQAIDAANGAKRFFKVGMDILANKDMVTPWIGFFLSGKKKRIKILTRLLQGYSNAARMLLSPFLLEESRYSIFCRELRKFTTNFLVGIGMDFRTADDFSEIFCALIEYDNAYRLRAEDILTETSKELMLKNPRKELKRLISILSQREPDGMAGNAQKFKKIVDVLSFGLYVPSYRKAFINALQASDFKNFQMDEADHYHTALWEDFNFWGLPIAERIEWYKDYHTKHPPFPPRPEITFNV